MDLVIGTDGHVRCVYSEVFDLAGLGELSISRASHVEPDHQGRWWVDLSPVRGPVLGPFPQRSSALAMESRWLADHLLAGAA